MSSHKSSPRPFTDAINRKRAEDGLRFIDLETKSSRARSTAWYNYLVNSTTPWKVNPPTKDTFTGLRKLLGVSEQVLKNWIAQEWYGSSPDNVSTRVTVLADAIDALSEEDYVMLVAVLTRMEDTPEPEKPVRHTRRVIEPSPRKDLVGVS